MHLGEKFFTAIFRAIILLGFHGFLCIFDIDEIENFQIEGQRNNLAAHIQYAIAVILKQLPLFDGNYLNLWFIYSSQQFGFFAGINQNNT